jgi:hypothetical protein
MAIEAGPCLAVPGGPARLYLYLKDRLEYKHVGRLVRISDLREHLDRKDLRAYGRILSGALYHQDKRLRFITFSLPLGFQKSMRRSALKSVLLWIRSRYGPAEYFAIETDEGNGVFHICMANHAFIPRDDLIDAWKKRTGAFLVDIRLVVREDGIPIQAFLQEMVRQSSAIRYSYSRHWMRPGHRVYRTKCYKAFYSRQKRIEYFNRWIESGFDELPEVRIHND